MPKFVAETSQRTIGHYQGRAEAFWEGTRDHDVVQNIEALIQNLEGSTPHHILDFGCGPGRDVKAFKERGFEVTGLDGCPAFCEMARSYSGCAVLHQDFLDLNLPEAHYSGIFANASLFHVPSAHLHRVLRQLYVSLQPQGVLFSSNPRGNNQEGWNGERYGAYHDLDAWKGWLEGAGFRYIHHYYRPAGLPRHEQNWLASTWRKI